MNPISSWICTSSSKNLFVKVVHPGGHVELHDRPIVAAELLRQNPKCCVAHPTVFHHPYTAIVSPTTTLTLGQKYYVVPIDAIKKLQLNYSSSSPVVVQTQKANVLLHGREKDGDEEKIESAYCWLMRHGKKGGKKVKNGKKVGSKKRGYGKSQGVGNVSLTSCDHHWQPGLESIIEE